MGTHAQWYLGAGYQHGYNLPLYDRSPETTRSSPFAHISLRYESQGLFGIVEQIYGNPTMSIQLGLQNLGNDDVMGNAFTIHPDFKFPLKQWRRWSWLWSGGLGLGWVTEPFDKATNPENQALGTHVNIYAQIQMNLEYRLSEDWIICAEGGMHHLSNSFFSYPNLGVNIPSGGLSLYRRIGEKKDREDNVYSPTEYDQKTPWRPFVRVIYGVTERAFDGPYFAVYGAGAGVTKKFRIHQQLTVGAEYLFDESRYNFLIHVNGKETGEEFNRASRYVLFVGHEYLIKHFSFLTEFGVYLKKQYDRQSLISTKAGFAIYPFNNLTKWKNQLSVGAYIRAYFLRADFFEIALNYRV